MRVLFFAQTKEAARTSELELKLPNQSGLEEIWRVLITARPALAQFQASTRLARNGEYTDGKTIFSDADEVALIPPVSGG